MVQFPFRLFFNSTPPKQKSETELEKLKRDENINKINFGNDDVIDIFNPKNFTKIRLISDGGQSNVYEYEHKQTAKKLAIKEIPLHYSPFLNPEKEKIMAQLIREINVHRALSKCPNIIEFYGFCIHESNALICMELMVMSLHKFYLRVHELLNRFPEDLLGNIAVSIIDALKYGKDRGIIHRDIKPLNILVNRAGYVKLCDFGLSRELMNSMASTHVGTRCYIAPERIANPNTKYDIRSDIWSLGITISELARGKLPFDFGSDATSVPEYVVFHKILNTKPEEIIKESFGDQYDKKTTNFVGLCLQPLDDRPFLTKKNEKPNAALIEEDFYLCHKSMFDIKVVQDYLIKFE